MSNPTRQEIIDAHDALESLCKRLPGTRRAEMAILAALPPIPRPTMAEVEWDDDKHYLAEAEHLQFGKVIMLGKGPLSGDVRITRIKGKGAIESHTLWQTVEPDSLTPTGKRYTLTEVQDG